MSFVAFSCCFWKSFPSSVTPIGCAVCVSLLDPASGGRSASARRTASPRATARSAPRAAPSGPRPGSPRGSSRASPGASCRPSGRRRRRTCRCRTSPRARTPTTCCVGRAAGRLRPGAARRGTGVGSLPVPFVSLGTAVEPARSGARSRDCASATPNSASAAARPAAIPKSNHVLHRMFPSRVVCALANKVRREREGRTGRAGVRRQDRRTGERTRGATAGRPRPLPRRPGGRPRPARARPLPAPRDA